MTSLRYTCNEEEESMWYGEDAGDAVVPSSSLPDKKAVLCDVTNTMASTHDSGDTESQNDLKKAFQDAVETVRTAEATIRPSPIEEKLVNRLPTITSTVYLHKAADTAAFCMVLPMLFLLSTSMVFISKVLSAHVLPKDLGF